MTEKDFLKEYDITKYDRPSIATDIVLFTLDNSIKNAKKVNVGPLQILLIKRASYPFKGQWALPGGFYEKGETLEEAAARELYEETNVRNAYLENTKTFSETGRDPRGWIVSNAFIGAINKSDCNLRADSDAWEAKWFNLSEEKGAGENCTVYNLTLTAEDDSCSINIVVKCDKTMEMGRVKHKWSICKSENLGFDHALIITELFQKLKNGILSDIRLLFEFVPETFTVGQLEATYKAIFNIDGKVPNFRRKIGNYIVETDEWERETSYRPPKLCVRNMEVF